MVGSVTMTADEAACGDVEHEHDDVAATALAPENPATIIDLLKADAETIDEQRNAPLTEKIRFTWREEDQSILDRIEIAASAKFAELFSDAIAEMNQFYMRLRVPRVDPNTGVVLQANGYYLWELDERGRPLERWDQLVGQDVEQCIMNLARIKLWVAPEVNRLKSRAVYSKMVAEDLKDDVWRRTAGGTVEDKRSKSNRESRQDRYHAFFNYHLWSVSDVFLREIVDFMFRLRDVRNWRVQDQRR